MKSITSDPCSHNQHEFCNEMECQCGCHYIKRHGGLTPEEYKERMKTLAVMEESI